MEVFASGEATLLITVLQQQQIAAAAAEAARTFKNATNLYESFGLDCFISRCIF